MTKNIGKYHLPNIWDEGLFNISEHKINISQVVIPSAIKAIISAIIKTFHPVRLFHLQQWQ